MVEQIRTTSSQLLIDELCGVCGMSWRPWAHVCTAGSPGKKEDLPLPSPKHCELKVEGSHDRMLHRLWLAWIHLEALWESAPILILDPFGFNMQPVWGFSFGRSQEASLGVLSVQEASFGSPRVTDGWSVDHTSAFFR